jgi:hypothetical protein
MLSMIFTLTLRFTQSCHKTIVWILSGTMAFIISAELFSCDEAHYSPYMIFFMLFCCAVHRNARNCERTTFVFL